MPGTLVRDKNRPVLHATSTVTATATDTGVQVDKPRTCRVRLQVTGVVSGTSPTLDVEIQSSNTSDFSAGVVSHGKFPTVTATLGTTAHYLYVDCQKTYMRSVLTVGGTGSPTFTATTVDVVEKHYESVATDTA